MRQWWIVMLNNGATCTVDTQDGVVVATAPLLSKFIGQKLDNILNWQAIQEVTGPYDA